ncbi:RimK family alpha-L-glutamate ligase [Nocardia sp. NPDC052566]|uniref:RimK family alpha-L-glutamate ligase n=1 Tax=Nocardia sp. NPDC052566 TaxID=3364330 RepID=UPI0037CA9A7B
MTDTNRGGDEVPEVVVVTDHASPEKSRIVLHEAVATLTGRVPIMLDARDFMSGGAGLAHFVDGRLVLEVARDGVAVAPDAVLVYEIDPADRPRLREFQDVLARSGIACFGADRQAWRNATDKSRTVDCFARRGIPYAATVTLRDQDEHIALASFARLGGDVWTRPVTGLGGAGVFRATTAGELLTARAYYAANDTRWQQCRDVRNIRSDGHRHQYRVVVLHDQVLRVCEHVQPRHDLPCNEARGAASTVLPPDALARGLRELAIAATRSLGLSFGGVDLVPQHGGCVFEVNVHPALRVPGGLESVALPLVAHTLGIDRW